jgi:hypothetical protein
VTRIDTVIVIWLAREGIRSLIRTFARNIDAMRDANVAQLFDVVNRLQPRVIISLEYGNSGERE